MDRKVAVALEAYNAIADGLDLTPPQKETFLKTVEADVRAGRLVVTKPKETR
jgi:hypothetical protein